MVAVEGVRPYEDIYPEADDGIEKHHLTNQLILSMSSEEGFTDEDYEAFVENLEKSERYTDEDTIDEIKADVMEQLTEALEVLPQDPRLENIEVDEKGRNIEMLLNGIKEQIYAQGAEPFTSIQIPSRSVSEREINKRSLDAVVYMLYFKDGVVCEVLLDPELNDPLFPNGIRLEYRVIPKKTNQ